MYVKKLKHNEKCRDCKGIFFKKKDMPIGNFNVSKYLTTLLLWLCETYLFKKSRLIWE